MKIRIRDLILLLLCILYDPVSGQQDTLIVQNGKAIEPIRYRDIEGSPYYFDDWVRGRVLRSDAMYVNDVLLNYNGYSHELEARVGGQTYALDKRWHLRADVAVADNPSLQNAHPDTIIFQQSVHRELSDKYGAILYRGKHYTLIRDYDVGRTEKEFNTVGAKIEVDRFKDLSVCYLKTEDALIQLKRHKKRIAEAFGDDERIRNYVTEHKPDVDNDRDLVELVRYADRLKD